MVAALKSSLKFLGGMNGVALIKHLCDLLRGSNVYETNHITELNSTQDGKSVFSVPKENHVSLLLSMYIRFYYQGVYLGF